MHNSKYTMEISGKLGIDPITGKLADGIGEQTEKAIEGIKSILAEVGWGLSNIVKARVYLTDMENYALMNEAYGMFFPGDFPARVALAVKALPMGALVEIECVACGDAAPV